MTLATVSSPSTPVEVQEYLDTHPGMTRREAKEALVAKGRSMGFSAHFGDEVDLDPAEPPASEGERMARVEANLAAGLAGGGGVGGSR